MIQCETQPPASPVFDPGDLVPVLVRAKKDDPPEQDEYDFLADGNIFTGVRLISSFLC